MRDVRQYPNEAIVRQCRYARLDQSSTIDAIARGDDAAVYARLAGRSNRSVRRIEDDAFLQRMEGRDATFPLGGAVVDVVVVVVGNYHGKAEDGRDEGIHLGI
jgi:hypothetical protein